MAPYYQSSFKDGKLTAESDSDNSDKDDSPGLPADDRVSYTS